MKFKLRCLLVGSLLIALVCSDVGLASKSTNMGRSVIHSWKHMPKPHVHDHKLLQFVNTLYRPNARIGSGSTADAVRHELATKQSIQGRSHLKKGRESITYLHKWLKANPNALHEDIVAASSILSDLEDAFSGSPSIKDTPVYETVSRDDKEVTLPPRDSKSSLCIIL